MTLTEAPGPRPGHLGQKRQVGQNSTAQVGQYSWTQPPPAFGPEADSVTAGAKLDFQEILLDRRTERGDRQRHAQAGRVRMLGVSEPDWSRQKRAGEGKEALMGKAPKEPKSFSAAKGTSKKPKKRTVSLAALGEGMPGLTPASGLRMAEAAAVCFENKNHQAGVRVRNAGLITEDFHFEWLSVDDQQRSCYADIQEATESGASGVAILVVKEITGLIVVERSRKNTGFDYWLGEKDYDGLPFVGSRRLEVSGILTGTKALIEARVRQKKDQMKPTDHVAPGLVAVVEFGTPIARVESK